MGYNYVILGAGRQGTAIAYDLAKNCEASFIVLADISLETADPAKDRVMKLLPDTNCEFCAVACDVGSTSDVASVIKGTDVVISAAPYRFNTSLTSNAVEAGVSSCDLGGNTSVVREQLSMHDKAVEAGISIVPDCGLAPGLGNHLAAAGIGMMDQPEHVHIRCGGLPEKKVGPLGYKLLFNFDGLINEYSGNAECLRDGKIEYVPTLTGLETIEFPNPTGKCEAAVTSGGTSTAPETFLGRLETYDYKTIRYPGHFKIIRAMFDLGCFDESFLRPDGSIVEPRKITQSLMEEKLAFPDVKDIALMRVTVEGIDKGKRMLITFDLLDHHDDITGFTAMERTTGFPTAIVAHMQARKLIAPGAKPLEISVPAQRFLDELPIHDIKVDIVSRETGSES